MTVGPRSRYDATAVTIVTGPDGSERVIVPARWSHRVPKDVAFHIVAEGDTFETLAHEFLGSSKLWWHIADANPLLFPLDLRVGSTVRLPLGSERAGPVRTRSW